ncbi:MAG: hypothetical protein WCZ20_01280 [Hydrogenophaga sp.]
MAAAAAVGAAAWFWTELSGWLVSAWQTAWRVAWRVASGHFSQSITLSMWQLYLLAILSIASVSSWLLRLIATRQDNHRRFTQVNLLGALWRWEYDMSGRPHGFRAYCPTCDMRLVYEHAWKPFPYDEQMETRLHCERCSTQWVRHDGKLDYLNERVAREIERLVRNGHWRDHVPQPAQKARKQD